MATFQTEYTANEFMALLNNSEKVEQSVGLAQTAAEQSQAALTEVQKIAKKPFLIQKIYDSVEAMELDYSTVDVVIGQFVQILMEDTTAEDHGKVYVKWISGWGYVGKLVVEGGGGLDPSQVRNLQISETSEGFVIQDVPVVYSDSILTGFGKLQGQVSTHKSESITEETGVHNFRYFDEKIQFFNGTDWINIPTGGSSVASNPNLLDNGDFRVNQRGLAEYPFSTWINKYTLDRWINWTVEAQNTIYPPTENTGLGINRAHNVHLIQVIPESTGKTYESLTFSVKLRCTNLGGIAPKVFLIVKDSATAQSNGTLIGRSDTLEPSGSDWSTLSATVSNVTIVNQLMVSIYFSVGGENVEWEFEYAKLEYGDTATPFVPRKYSEELAECQRYYQIRSIGTVNDVDLRPNMRITPTKTELSSGNWEYNAEL